MRAPHDFLKNRKASARTCQVQGRQGETASPGKLLLLIDHDVVHAKNLIDSLTTRGLTVELCETVKQAVIKLCEPGEYAVTIVNVSDASQPWLRLLQVLHEAAFQSGKAIGPLYLCVSTVKRDPLFELQVERMGARLVYEQ